MFALTLLRSRPACRCQIMLVKRLSNQSLDDGLAAVFPHLKDERVQFCSHPADSSVLLRHVRALIKAGVPAREQRSVATSE
jgi:hypothetical protein